MTVPNFSDELDRLETANRGAKGSPFTHVADNPNFTAGQAWTLDLIGNWDEVVTDKDADGADGDGTDVTEPRTHNDVNELTDRDPEGPLLDLTYDKAGNLREQDLSDTAAYRYTHDAWGRLVTIEHVTDPEVVRVRAELEYNGLNWMTVKRADTDEPPDNDLDQERTRYYSADWQLVEERIDDDLGTGVDRHVHFIWGIRYIDDLAMRREDGNTDGDFKDPEDSTWYHLSDAQFSTVAIIDDAAALVERVSYDAYGQARHHYMADVDGDGDADANDFAIINSLAQSPGFPPGTPIEDRDYNVDADIDRSGRVDPTDYDIAAAEGQQTALAIGLLSDDDVDSIFGFSGYVYNGEVALYTVRFRHYDTILGRWLERDPLGYADGANLYGYVSGSPLDALDPFGLVERRKPKPPRPAPGPGPGPHMVPLYPGDPGFDEASRFMERMRAQTNRVARVGPDHGFWYFFLTDWGMWVDVGLVLVPGGAVLRYGRVGIKALRATRFGKWLGQGAHSLFESAFALGPGGIAAAYEGLAYLMGRGMIIIMSKTVRRRLGGAGGQIVIGVHEGLIKSLTRSNDYLGPETRNPHRRLGRGIGEGVGTFCKKVGVFP